MLTKRESFLLNYEKIVTSISPALKALPNYQNLFGPHIPGAGHTYWNNENIPKIAFVGKDVGAGKKLEQNLDDISLFVQFSSDLMNEIDILNWNRNYGQFAAAVIYLLAQIYNVPEEDLTSCRRNDILSSFVWAQANSILNYKSFKANNAELTYETWDTLRHICKPLDSLKLLADAVNPDIVIIFCWDCNAYLDVPNYSVVKEKKHLRYLKNERDNKHIIHTCHQSHWRSDYSSDPFYTRLNEILDILKDEISIDTFFT
ncbi:MAG TPA: hypothetical protein VGN63_15180 [Flavisolibacter sp.]|jgi:hypothetical protein|nr:hypothetical protein [Flavisolibacter sp.]